MQSLMLSRAMKRQWARSLLKPLAQIMHRNWQRLELPQSFCLCDYSRHLHSQAMISMHIIKMLLSPKVLLETQIRRRALTAIQELYLHGSTSWTG